MSSYQIVIKIEETYKKYNVSSSLPERVKLHKLYILVFWYLDFFLLSLTIKHNYSKTISSLTNFLKKDSCFPLNEESLGQFYQLKEACNTAPILSHCNPSLPIIVETDASDYALGAVLSHLSESGKHQMEFNSHKHLLAELNYDIYHKELLGIVLALKH